MPFQDVYKNALGYLGISPEANPGVIPDAGRAPTSNDLAEIGTLWIHKSANAVYCLSSVVSGAANWELLGSPSGAVSSIAGDSGSASPSSGVITFDGTAADGSSFSGSGSTITHSISAATTSQRGTLETATDTEARGLADTAAALTASNIAALAAYTDVVCEQSPILQSNANTGAAPSGSTGDVNLMHLNDGLFGETMEQFIMGAGQTIIAPRMTTSGLLVSLDLTDDEGAEYNWGARANARHVFTAGTDAFFLEWNFTLADVTGCDPVGIGFRKVEANNGTLESYTDFAFIGVSESDNSALITIKTRLNSGAVTNTNTTDAWADGETHRLAILVDAAGAVTYTIDGAAPTATAAFSFDATDTIMPFWHGLHGTTSPGAWNWVDFKCGLQ